MKTQDTYLQFVRGSDEDKTYIGYCPNLFPAGGVCRGRTAPEAFAKLCKIVADTVKTAEAQGLPLPPSRTKPTREVELAA